MILGRHGLPHFATPAYTEERGGDRVRWRIAEKGGKKMRRMNNGLCEKKNPDKQVDKDDQISTKKL